MNYTHVQPVFNFSTTSIPSRFDIDRSAGDNCVIAARFSGSSRQYSSTVLALNMCGDEVTVDGQKGIAKWLSYDGTSAGGWVLADHIGSLEQPLWTNGPVPVTHQNILELEDNIRLPRMSLNVLHFD